jgi:hypothetical protein
VTRIDENDVSVGIENASAVARSLVVRSGKMVLNIRSP